MIPDDDLYGMLGLARDATEAEVVAAYRRRVKRAHPDVGGKTETFHRLTLAYQVLRDPRMRARYDETGTVDDRAVVDQHQLVIGLLRDLFADALAKGLAERADIDPIPALRAALGERKRMLDESGRKIAKRVKNLKALRATITRADDGAPNVFVAQIDLHLRQAAMDKARVAIDRDLAALALDEISHYSSFARLARGTGFLATVHGSTTTS